MTITKQNFDLINKFAGTSMTCEKYSWDELLKVYDICMATGFDTDLWGDLMEAHECDDTYSLVGGLVDFINGTYANLETKMQEIADCKTTVLEEVEWQGKTFVITKVENKDGGIGKFYHCHLKSDTSIQVRFDGLDINKN